MRLYLMRHAEAASAPGPGVHADADRALTDAGRQDARSVGEGLRRLKLDIRAVVSSPLRRALETAKEVSAVLGLSAPVRQWLEVEPGASPALASRKLAELGAFSSALVVGHEPHMSAWISELAGGGQLQCVMKKASVACIDLERVPPPDGGGLLRWLMTAKQLSLIGKAAWQ